ncbi:hypothetical protein CDL15_Pgr010066 [Punica granatum]|uniref:Uncharacterized protein n=1 Tax=Punica granatum TaxID=22663 RepID=A0A218X5L4_PUNGR|nr:hypothetical protein CDL15_Pgr010066 [Punica granatum]
METAGNLNQMQIVVQLIGTQFKGALPNIQLPANIALINEGYSCPNDYTMRDVFDIVSTLLGKVVYNKKEIVSYKMII